MFRICFLVTSLLLFSCKNASEMEGAVCRIQKPDEKAIVFFDEISVVVEIWKSNRQNYKLAYSTINNPFSDIVSYIKCDFIEGSASSLVIYLDTKIQDSSLVTPSDIVGLGCYYLESEKMKFKFALKEGDIYRVVEELSCEEKVLTTNDISEIAYLFFRNKESIYALTIVNKNLLFKENNSQPNVLAKKIKRLKRVM